MLIPLACRLFECLPTWAHAFIHMPSAWWPVCSQFVSSLAHIGGGSHGEDKRQNVRMPFSDDTTDRSSRDFVRGRYFVKEMGAGDHKSLLK